MEKENQTTIYGKNNFAQNDFARGLLSVGFIYPLEPFFQYKLPRSGHQFSACLKIWRSHFKVKSLQKAKTLGRRFSLMNADKNKNQR